MLVSLPFKAAISLMCGGGGHTLIAVDDGRRVFACGWNNKGQLGLGDLKDRTEFEEIQLKLRDDERIQQLSCGWDTSAVLTSHNRLFVFGGNAFNQLGLENIKENVTLPRELKLPEGEKPLEISLAMRHILIRTEDRIFISGKSQVLKDIRHQKMEIEEYPPFVAFKPNEVVDKLSSGQHHIIYSSCSGGKIAGIGQNKFYQTEVLNFPEQIVDICSGWTHNAALTAPGEVFLWGRNCYGQLGTGKTTECEGIPIKLNIHEKVHKISLGSEHGLVQTVNGNIYTWGWNEHGNCGNGTTENVLTPERIEIPGSKKASLSVCGAGFCFVVVN